MWIKNPVENERNVKWPCKRRDKTKTRQNKTRIDQGQDIARPKQDKDKTKRS